MRLHPSIRALKAKIQSQTNKKHFDVKLDYVTSRGSWYFESWKGDESKSGGLAFNIGIHFFDMLLHLFGDVLSSEVFKRNFDVASGCLKFERATVNWMLSVSKDYLPIETQQKGQTTYRSITIDGEEIEFSAGFTDLHIESYASILKGDGFKAEETRKSIELVHAINHSKFLDSRAALSNKYFIDIRVGGHRYLR